MCKLLIVIAYLCTGKVGKHERRKRQGDGAPDDTGGTNDDDDDAPAGDASGDESQRPAKTARC